MNAGNFIDERDGRTYRTIKIGSQIWMAENLNFATAEGSWCYWTYENKYSNSDKYGRLYDWETSQIVAPLSWHLPSMRDWETLIGYFGDEKKAYIELLPGGLSGFNLLFGGQRRVNCDHGWTDFVEIGASSLWWSSTDDELKEWSPTQNDADEEADSDEEVQYAWGCMARSENEDIVLCNDFKKCGYSVRCVRGVISYDESEAGE